MTAPPRKLLPLLTRPGGRSPMTCQYRCGNACSHPAPNTSDNPYFGDLVNAETSRRGLLRAGALGALVIGAGAALAAEPGQPARAAHPQPHAGTHPPLAAHPPAGRPHKGRPILCLSPENLGTCPVKFDLDQSACLINPQPWY